VRGVRSCTGEVAVNVQDMNFFGSSPHQCLRSSDHHTAIAADQKRDLSRPLQAWCNAITDAVANDARPRPVPDGRHGVMRQITPNSDIAIVNNILAHRLQPRHQLNIAIRLGTIFIPRNQRTRAQRNSENVIRVVRGAG
jgi:hypothetical protein